MTSPRTLLAALTALAVGITAPGCGGETEPSALDATADATVDSKGAPVLWRAHLRADLCQSDQGSTPCETMAPVSTPQLRGAIASGILGTLDALPPAATLFEKQEPGSLDQLTLFVPELRCESPLERDPATGTFVPPTHLAHGKDPVSSLNGWYLSLAIPHAVPAGPCRADSLAATRRIPYAHPPVLLGQTDEAWWQQTHTLMATFVPWFLGLPFRTDKQCWFWDTKNEKCWLAGSLAFLAPTDADADTQTQDALLARYATLFDAWYSLPYRRAGSNHAVFGPNVWFDPSPEEARLGTFDWTHPLGRFLKRFMASGRVPISLSFRTAATSGSELARTVRMVFAAGESLGRRELHKWTREIAVYHLDPLEPTEPRRSPGVEAWRRGMVHLAAMIRLARSDGEQKWIFHQGTYTATWEPRGAYRPADLTTSGDAPAGAGEPGAPRWRAGAMALRMGSKALWEVVMAAEPAQCWFDAPCGWVDPQAPWKYNPWQMRPIVMDLDLALGVTPFSAPAEWDRPLAAMAVRGNCLPNASGALDCFAGTNYLLRSAQAVAADPHAVVSRSRFLRALVVDERELVARGAAPAAGVAVLTLAIPDPVADVVVRSAALPGPDVELDALAFEAARTVDVVGGEVSVEIPVTRPGAVLVEVAW